MASGIKKIKGLIPSLWRWSWVVTLPVTVVFCVWAVNTAKTYYDFNLRFNDNKDLDLSRIGSIEAESLLSGVKARLFTPRSVKGLEKFQIYVAESELKKLDSNLPYSGREYVEAMLMYPDGKIHEVALKYRGDYSYHWIGEKKSLRIKTKKSRLHDGVRQFNLIVPKTPYIFDNHLPYLLAKRMGLLAPDSRLVEVYINGQYMGVEVYVEQLGEQFLRRNGLMPGDIYVGEMVGKDSFRGVPKEVFLNPAYWTKDAVNNHNPPEWNVALKQLSSSIYREDIDGMLGLLDLDSWARFSAFITIAQTSHFDSMHNWRLYFDPAMGRFKPIVWDPAGWNFKAYVGWITQQTNRMDIISSVIFERLHRDHRFLAAKHAAIESFFREGGEEFILKNLSETDALESSLKRDRNLYFDATYTLSPAEVMGEIGEYGKEVEKVLAGIRKAYLESAPEAAYSVGKTGVVQLNIGSFSPLEYIEIDYGSPVRNIGGSVSYEKGGQTVRRDVSGSIRAVSSATLRLEAPLFAARVMNPVSDKQPVLLRDLAIEPASYFIDISGSRGKTVLGIRAGYGGGKTFELEKKGSLGLFPLDNNFHAAPFKERRAEAVWSNDVLVDGVKEVSGDLTIRPGTTVRFAPGASLVIKGRLYAAGSAQSPIRFMPVDGAEAPWGAVVLSGEGANGSRLGNCSFKGGSGLRHRLVEYSAMLSIHGVKDMVIEDCSFSDNKEVDDMVHAVYSEVTVRGSSFSGARADALDLDYVKGRVINSRFTKSGNDALDLMSSEVAVLGSVMEGSGDKGISVGEGTEVFVWNTLLEGNEIGLQAKDSSTAVLYNVELSGNRLSVDAYNKNWQYGTGGHALIFKSLVSGSGPLITADKRSSVKIFDSYIDGDTGGKSKKVHIDPTVDTGGEAKGKARNGLKLPDGVTLPGFASPFLEFVDPAVRGRTDG